MRTSQLPLGAIATERRALDRRVPGLRPAFSLQGARGRGAISWQTMLADLALILFMVTAAAMGQPAKTPAHHPPAEAPTNRAKPMASPYSARGEVLALWRAGPEAPPLAAWLGAQAADQRQQLTISAAYQPGHFAEAAAKAADLATQAGVMGHKARLVIEPAEPSGAAAKVEISASLAFDRPDPVSPPTALAPALAPAGLARPLHGAGQTKPS